MFVCPACARAFPAPGFCTEDGSALGDASADPLLGQSVGSYRIAGRIGQGGMGVVYLGVQPTIGSRVAVKVLSMAASASPELVERFFAEARAVNLIRHESIVNVLDLATLPDGRPYIVMEHLEGAPLARHFAATRPFPLPSLVRLGLEVLGALGAAHAVGITHRDLKPDNVFVTTLGRAKVLDFGVAKLRPDLGLSDGTRTGALLGTPQYMSPEQALGRDVDHRSDIYSLGVILFEGATGRLPFEAESLYELLRMHVESSPPAPSRLRAELPPPLEAIILRALAKDRAARFQSALELAAALSAVSRQLPDAETLPVPAPQPPPRVPLAPTAPAHGHTNATSGSGMSSTLGAPRATRPNLGMLVGIVGVVVALLALAIAGVALFVSAEGLWAPGKPVASAAQQPAAAGFDVTAELDRMRLRAREQLPDAELQTVSAVGVSSDGTLDVTQQNRSVAYIFRSEAASKKGDSACMVVVSVSMYGTHVSPYRDTALPPCAQPVIRAPRCSTRQVVESIGSNAKISSLSFMYQRGAWAWVVVLDGGAIHIKQDAC